MSYGIIGIGTMGYNLALNLDNRFDMHAYNRTPEKMKDLLKCTANTRGHESICEMVSSMKRPRTIMTVVPHGEASDTVIQHLAKVIEKSDTIIDCSDEHYNVSRRRADFCSSRDIKYLGVGVGASVRENPSMMIGGPRSYYDEHKDFLNSLSHNVTYMGPSAGDGHYTKMIQNGIQYGMFQSVADIFAYCDQKTENMTRVLMCLKDTDIDGTLVQRIPDILRLYGMSEISDVAEMSNSGIWCVHHGLDMYIPVPVMTSAVNARIVSRYSKSIDTSQKPNPFFDPELAAQTLRFVFASVIGEGYALASARPFKSKKVKKAWSTGTTIECPLISSNVHQVMDDTIGDARTFVMHCSRSGIPCPAIQAALTHYDFIAQRKTSMGFVMAQRNYFGN